MNSRTSALSFLLASALLPSLALAQSGLIGLTGGSVPTVMHIDPNNCALGPRCAVVNLPAVTTRFAGGTAYDPEHRAVWISNGTHLARVDADSCRIQCGPFLALIGPILPNTFVTGLAYRASLRRLYVVDSLRRLTIFDVDGCDLTLVDRCTLNIGLPNSFIIGGLAVDEVSGRLFYSASDFAVPSISQSEVVFIAEQDVPCDPICAVRLSDCSGLGILGPVTGLAFDSCSHRLYATNGGEIVSARLLFAADGSCSLGAIRCCLPTIIDSRLVGLSVRPSAPIVSLGRFCNNGACPNCVGMEHVISSDPTIGNPGLHFDLRRAPDDSLAFLIINQGSCRFPGVTIPPFCGPILVDLVRTPPIIRGAVLTGNPGLNNCDGFARFSFAVPMSPALCGQEFASQYVVVCLRGLNLGTAVSNCQSFVISGS